MHEYDYHETDDMEMPCRCNCGAWFDLNEGFHDLKHDANVVCPNCHEQQLKAKMIRMKIRELEIIEKPLFPVRQQIYKLKQQLIEMGEDPED